MYWNPYPSCSACFASMINRNMRCIEMQVSLAPWADVPTINRNMRCIEICSGCHSHRIEKGLIETWDVLKYWLILSKPLSPPKINRNMRCIEITRIIAKTNWRSRINRNMRCIEIQQPLHSGCSAPRLIETWDVLKCFASFASRSVNSD